jgi:hypothetical protein
MKTHIDSSDESEYSSDAKDEDSEAGDPKAELKAEKNKILHKRRNFNILLFCPLSSTRQMTSKIEELDFNEDSDIDSSDESEYSSDAKDEDSEAGDPKAELKAEKNKILQKRRLFGFLSFGPLFSSPARHKFLVILRTSLHWLHRGLKFGGGIAWIFCTAFLFLVIPLQRAIALENLFEEEKKLFEKEQQQLKNLGLDH